jgi:putative hydrolase of the HAD superfamily
MTPDVLLFDLGGVVIDIDTRRIFARWAELAGCDVNLIAARVRFDGAYHRYERGEISVQEFFADLRAGLNINLSDEQFLDGWNAIFVGEMPGIAAALENARRTRTLYAFSNTNGAHVDCFSQRFADVLSHFKHVFISSTIGLRKPDPAAFAHVVQEIGVPARRILFFDDVAENIAGAKAVGLQTVHVDTRGRVAEVLAAL